MGSAELVDRVLGRPDRSVIDAHSWHFAVPGPDAQAARGAGPAHGDRPAGPARGPGQQREGRRWRKNSCAARGPIEVFPGAAELLGNLQASMIGKLGSGQRTPR
jgi:hypothetical protein